MNCPACQTENLPAASACTQCGKALVAITTYVITVDLSPGTLFDARYEILGPLGRGGMGMVYKAHDRTLDENVAIKVLRPDFAQDPKMAERFKSEIKLARRVRHKNVCTIHDYGEDQGLLYISMELIDGVDLKHILKERGGLPPEEAYGVAEQVAEGLGAVHEAGIIHRDLKTPNIMLDSAGVARLMDFGIAKRQGDGTATATGHIMGTPEYMSPEQAQGRKLDFRSDIYALGIVTWEIFTGQVPFRGETPISTILKHLHDPPPLDGPPAARLPPDLKPVLRKALSKDSAARHATAQAFAEGLRHARSPSRRQQPVPTSVLQAPTLKAEVAGGRAARRGWFVGLGLVALTAGAYVVQKRDPAPPPAQALPVRTSPSVPLPAPSAVATAALPVADALVSPVPTLAVSPSPRPTPARTPRAQEPDQRRAAVTPAATLATPPGFPASLPTTAPTTAPATTLAAAPAVDATAGPGLLQLAVKPWGEVTVDGAPMGTTPIDKVSLTAGLHLIRIRHPAYEPIERRVAIRPGQTERLAIDFPADGVKKP